MEDGCNAAGPQEAGRQPFQPSNLAGIDGEQRKGPPHGPGSPQGTGLFRRRLNGDKEKNGPGYQWGVPKYVV